MGASTYTKTLVGASVFGDKRIHLLKYTCTSYGTDGLPVTAAIVGMAAIDFVLPSFAGTGGVANGPVSAWWDQTNSVIKLLKASNSGVDAGTNITTAGYVYALVIGS